MDCDARKILVVRLDRVGDLIVSTPFIAAIRAKYPSAEINLLVRRYTAETARKIPAINNVIVAPSLKNPFALAGFLRHFVFSKYDVCVDMNCASSKTANFLTLLSGAKVRLSFKGKYSKFVHTHTIPAPREDEHMLYRHLRLAKFFNAQYDYKMVLVPSAEDRAKADKIFEELNFKNSAMKIAVHPGNFKKYHNRWPRHKFIELTKKILSLENVEVVYLTGPGETAKINEMLAKLPPGVKCVPPVPIGVMGALLEKMDISIVSGTATMHLAAAMGVPMLTILSKYAYECWRPLDNKGINVCSDQWRTCRTIPVEKALDAFAVLHKKWKERKTTF